jgi:hypothetical protein
MQNVLTDDTCDASENDKFGNFINLIIMRIGLFK